MADNKRRGRFTKGSEDAAQSIFDLFEPPPEQEAGSFGRIPIIRDDEEDDGLDLTNVEYVEAQAAAEAEAAGLQHWTEPATGQVPAALGADDDQRSGGVSGPSWRGDDPNWVGPDLADVFADTDAITHERVIDRQDRLEGTTDSGSKRAQPRLVAPERQASPTKQASPSIFDEAPRIDTPRRNAGERPARTAMPTPSDVPMPDAGRRHTRQSAEQSAESGGHSARESMRPAPDLPAPIPPAVPARATPATAASRAAPATGRQSIVPPPAAVTAKREQATRGGRLSAGSPAGLPGLRDDEAQRGRGAHDVASHSTGPVAQAHRPPLQERRPTSRPVVPPPDRPRPATEQTDQRARLLQDQAGNSGSQDFGDFEESDEHEPKGRSLGQSMVVGVALVALVFVTLGLGQIPTMVLVGVLTLLAVMELFNAMRLAGLRPATLLGLVGAVALPAATYVRGDAGYPLVVGLAVVFGMLWYLTGADTERPVLNLGLTLTGILWVGGLAGFAALMVRSEEGIGLLLATILITASSDTLGYLGGKAYGTKPFHSASPSKTWEGTLTGFFGALFAGLVLGVTDLIGTFDGQFVNVMVLAVVVGVLAPIGDLAESLVKRDLGIKDMGTLLPGHGGVLDRVDGLLFALPGAYYVAVVYQLL